MEVRTDSAIPSGVSRRSALSARRDNRYSAREVNMRYGSLTPRGNTIIAHTPMGKFGDPQDLIGALLWLVSDEGAGFVTGTVIPVDGGFSAFSGV